MAQPKSDWLKRRGFSRPANDDLEPEINDSCTSLQDIASELHITEIDLIGRARELREDSL